MGNQREGRTETGYHTEGSGKILGGNIDVWAHPKLGNLEAKRSEGYDHEVPKTEVPLGRTDNRWIHLVVE